MSSPDELLRRPRPSGRVTQKRGGRRNHSGPQRLLFVLALLTLGFASSYTGIALLSRTYPALFPGKTLSGVLPLADPLARIGIAAPDSKSVFNRRINLLIMGIDQRPDGVVLEPANTDTIMVASIDPASKQMSLVSIPRDLWVDLSNSDGSTGQDRINASWAMGVLRGKTAEAGAKQLEADLKRNFGIAVDYWVLLDFRSAEKLFDAVGGVDVQIPPELEVPQWFYSDDDIHGQWLSFPAGNHHLNGYNAVAFGRYRSTDSDLFRVKRQQLVLTAALEKVVSLGLLNNPFDLWDAYGSLIKTDIPRGKMPGYALLMKDANQHVRTYSLGDAVDGVTTVRGWVTPGGADVLLWDATNVEYWLAQAFSKSVYVGSHVEIHSANGRGNDALEIGIGHYLEFKGLPNVAVGPDDPLSADTYVEVIGDDGQELGADIAHWLKLPPGSVKTVPRADPSEPDVVVIVGTAFKLPDS